MSTSHVSAVSPSSVSKQSPSNNDPEYDVFRGRLAARIPKDQPLFRAGVDESLLWSTYLNSFPEDRRQHYNCHCCRRFVMAYGDLVTVNDQGRLESVLWKEEDQDCGIFAKVSESLRKVVEDHRKVSGVVLPAKDLGWPQTGEWSHLYLTAPKTYGTKLKTAGQLEAEVAEQFRGLRESLRTYPRWVIDQAAALLKTDKLYRSNEAVEIADWFRKVSDAVDPVRDSDKAHNLTYRFAATAPNGWCFISARVIGTLLDDLMAKMNYDDVAARWKKKLNPLQYLRPSAAPSDGQVDRAEAIVEKLGLQKSFERRFAKLEDVLCHLWVPRAETVKQAEGMFASVRPSVPAADKLKLPAETMTWVKFEKSVLPNVTSMKVLIPASGNFVGLVTAVHADAPPILRWDGLEGFPRNPCSQYIYQPRSTASQWGLAAGTWANVTMVYSSPEIWQRPDLFGKSATTCVTLAIEGCRDVGRYNGAAIFPETLKSDLHEIRHTIEAFSRKQRLAGMEEGTANGLLVSKSSPVRLLVTTALGECEYLIDRID